MQLILKKRSTNPFAPQRLVDTRIMVNEEGKPSGIFHPVILPGGEGQFPVESDITPRRFQQESRSRARGYNTTQGHEIEINPDLDLNKIMGNSANGVCHLCGEPFKNGESISFDHLFPLSKGGHHVEENLRAAHTDHNRTRGDRDLTAEEWSRTHVGGIPGEDVRKRMSYL